MSNALIHTLAQALETLEEQHDPRTADRVVQRIRLFPEKYQHISYKIENAIKLGYPSALTDQVLDELEHILHEVKEENKINKQRNYSEPSFDKKPKFISTPKTSKEPREKQVDKQARTQSHPLVRAYGNEVPEGVVTIPYFQRKARHPHQKVMQRIQNKGKLEQRIENFDKAIIQSSQVTRKDGKKILLKPEINLDLWLRPEYLPTTRFPANTAPEILDVEILAQTLKYLEPGEPNQHFSDPSLGEDTLQQMKEDGSIFFFKKQQWDRIIKQPNRFNFDEEV